MNEIEQPQVYDDSTALNDLAITPEPAPRKPWGQGFAQWEGETDEQFAARSMRHREIASMGGRATKRF